MPTLPSRLRRSARALVVFPLILGIGGCASWSGARHYRAGSQALEDGRAAAAISHLERAATLVPHASEVHNHLGIAYQAAGRRREALAAYQRAVDLDCDNAPAQHNLEALRHHLGLAAAGGESERGRRDSAGDAEVAGDGAR